MGDDVGRVGKHGAQRPELLEVLWDLSTQRVPPRRKVITLSTVLQVLVVRGLVVGSVVVAHARGPAGGLEQHGREVDRQQLDLLVDVIGGHLVHPLEQRHRGVEHVDRLIGAGDARVGLTRRGISEGASTGWRLSQYGSERRAGSADIRLWRWVVPVRGRPQITIGRSISISWISGWRRSRSSISSLLRRCRSAG